MATISDNIANSETKGYKRATIEFNSLVLSERPTSYDAGGVRASTLRAIEDQGAILSTRNVLDLAISGRGFLPVGDVASVRRGDPLALQLTRTGQFRPDYQGFLTTASGLTLHGWKARNDGTFGDVVRDGPSGLVPVQLDPLSLATERTTFVDIKANLKSNAATGESYIMPIEYFDALGNSKYLDIRYEKTATANEWNMVVFKRPNGGWADEGGAPVMSDLRDLNQIRGSFRLTFDASDGANSGGIKTITSGASAFAYTTDDGAPSVGTLTLDASFHSVVSNPTMGADGLYNVNVSDTVTDPSAAPTDTLSIRLGIGKPGVGGGLMQIATNFQVLSVVKDGFPASSMIGVEIDETGLLDAIYDTGFRRTLYKIPIGHVQNPNGMKTLDGQAFAITRKSGNVYFYDAGSGPTGSLISSALEESTTDIAEELTQLIKTQRAYSSNAKVIQTVDEMLQETTNLKR